MPRLAAEAASAQCECALLGEIIDMKRFFTDYCLTFLEKVGHGGACGNVWVASRESWYAVEKN